MKHNYLCRINKNFTLIYRINGGPTTNLYNSSLLSSSPFNSIAQSSERERERERERWRGGSRRSKHRGEMQRRIRRLRALSLKPEPLASKLSVPSARSFILFRLSCFGFGFLSLLLTSNQKTLQNVSDVYRFW